jgi:hypothetical protein
VDLEVLAKVFKGLLRKGMQDHLAGKRSVLACWLAGIELPAAGGSELYHTRVGRTVVAEFRLRLNMLQGTYWFEGHEISAQLVRTIAQILFMLKPSDNLKHVGDRRREVLMLIGVQLGPQFDLTPDSWSHRQEPRFMLLLAEAITDPALVARRRL